MTIGQRIALLRKKNSWTQEQLSTFLGITRAALSHYEKNRRHPDYKTSQRLADVFNVQIDYLMGRTDNTVVNADKFNSPMLKGCQMSDEQILDNFSINISDLNLTAIQLHRLIKCLRYFVR